MNIALLTLATGPAYRDYANAMIASAHRFWPEAMTIVFSDSLYHIKGSDICVHTDSKGYPGETLYRYHTFLGAEQLLRKFDYVFYCDADMLWVAPANDAMIGKGLTATLHPGYVGRRGTPETRMESAACSPAIGVPYYCGGFQGGTAESYIDAMKNMRARIDIDARNGITAVWHDESHWNRELMTTSWPIKVLTPSYCYPEDYTGQWGWPPEKYPPILLALDKKKRGNHWCQR